MFLSQTCFFAVCIYLNQKLAQATVFSCNKTALCGCSRYNVNITSRTINAEPIVSHSWGWAVSLRVMNELHFCGGAILSKNYILTAAHCVDDGEITDFELQAAVGTDSLSDNFGQRLSISKIFLHPHWTPRTNENDIAILKLKKPIDFTDSNIAKICLPPKNKLKATEFSVMKSPLVAIGWGYTTLDGIESDIIKQITLEAIGNKETKCNNSINNVTLQFCADVNSGGKDTCEGDSGGPLMHYSEKYRQWIMVGITSYARGCGVSIQAGVYTRVSMYIDWIKSIVGKDGAIIAGENRASVDKSSTLIIAPNRSKMNARSAVTIAENSANVGIMSNILFMTLFLCLISMRFL